MGRARLLPAVLLLVLLASCGSQTATVPTAVLTPTATPVPHAPEIRLALIGGVTSANVWALFDAQGYSYNNYAVRSEYWPRLYRLSIPGRQFEPMAASDMPSLVQQAGDFYTATVPLRSDLSWSNGSSFTAEDVAFTVNAALSFKLGFDWRDYYNPAVLDHAEALNSSTVKYYFKQMPDVGAWQYSVLQGPIVQKAYWASKVSSSAALLPPTDLGLQIDELKTKVTDLQQQVDALQAANGTTTGEEARQTQASLTRQEGDLDQAINDLAKAQSDFDAAMSAARQSLYALGDGNEPRLGIWEYSGSANRAVTNEANPDFPLGQPNFDRAVYQFYPDQDAAVTALANDEVDVVLALEVLSSQSLAGNPAFQVMNSPTHSLRFLVFNPLSDAFGDAAVRQALACMLDQDQAAGQLPGQVLPLKSFVLPGESFWYNPDAPLSCKGLDPGSRLALAIQILKTAGYTWTREPAPDIPGQGLASAAGERLPAVSLIAPSSDAPRAAAASYIEGQARLLGIPLTTQLVSSEQLDYDVFSSHRYDLALLGWRVGAYPGYLCEWFGAGNPFHYDESRLKSLCEALDGTSDLDNARQRVFEIQAVLTQDVPFVPLFSMLKQDAYRGLSYPFDQVLDGLSGVYGAPSLAVPALP